jgi:energy-coupling factor transporter transmembrane protein EcfT
MDASAPVNLNPLSPASKVLGCGLGLIAIAGIELPSQHLLLPVLFWICCLYLFSVRNWSAALASLLSGLLPLALVVAGIWLSRGKAHALLVAQRGLLSLILVVWLIQSGDRWEWLRGLKALKVPSILVSISAFLLRFLEVLITEARQMRQAATNRLGGRSWKQAIDFKIAGALLAALLGRAFARAQRVQEAMDARSFSGNLPLRASPSMAWKDWTFVAIAFSLVLTVWASKFSR